MMISANSIWSTNRLTRVRSSPLASNLSAVDEKIGGGIVLEQVHGVDHRHHRIKPREIRQALPFFIAKFEGGRNGQRFRNPRTFDQEIVETAFLSQFADLNQQIIAKRAANAAIGHFDQLFFRPVQDSFFPDQIGINIHFAHIVDDHSDPSAIPVVENMVEQGRLSTPKEAG